MVEKSKDTEMNKSVAIRNVENNSENGIGHKNNDDKKY